MSETTSLKLPKPLHKRIAALAAKRIPPVKAPGLAAYALDKFATAEEAKQSREGSK